MRRAGILTALLTSLALAPAAQAAAPAVHAHRGGPNALGAALHPENTIAAFAEAHARGDVIELDALLTADGRGVVIHDSSLDRTTVCAGAVNTFTLAALAACPTDVIGIGPAAAPTARREPLPSLADTLNWAHAAGATLNLEIKNIPTEGGFDPTTAFATKIVGEIKASGFPADRLIIQSFWPTNLDVSEQLLPAVPTSLLTLNQLNDGAPLFAKARGYEWVSPQWPVRAQTVGLAHALGLKVVPWTIDDAAGVQAAAAAGADAVISNDAVMARAALGG